MNELQTIDTTPQALPLRWWAYHQNNSGGYFITDEKVAEYVFVQARDAAEAQTRADAIFDEDDRRVYCSCCGERWYGPNEDEGTAQPMIYETSIYDVTPHTFCTECRLHFFDGSVEKYSFGDPVPTRIG